MPHWSQDAIFYHLYPLGLCAAPRQNDFTSAPQPRLERLLPWLDQAVSLGADALYLGPVMEANAHGYDTADYFNLDRRLGDNQTMAWLAAEVRARGLRLVLEGVFHHVGRAFWAFRDVLAKGRDSRFRDWFHLDFAGDSAHGDGFAYESWAGCQDLVKLNLGNPEVRSHLFEAVASWLRDYRMDGLRLDAADKIDMGFLRELSGYCRSLRPDFWLLGEVLHGDYRLWRDQGGLDSVTNYQCYKGIYSSHNDGNFFEIAHSLRRQFDEFGLYRDLPLYNFVDNHDVNRLASRLHEQAHQYPAYCLLFTMPGIPSIYYGGEFGLRGEKAPDHDWDLRPSLDLGQLRERSPQPQLRSVIEKLARLRRELPALRRGGYQQLAVGSRHLVFSRTWEGQRVVVAVSAEPNPIKVNLDLRGAGQGRMADLLNDGESFLAQGGRLANLSLWPNWARVLVDA